MICRERPCHSHRLIVLEISFYPIIKQVQIPHSRQISSHIINLSLHVMLTCRYYYGFITLLGSAFSSIIIDKIRLKYLDKPFCNRCTLFVYEMVWFRGGCRGGVRGLVVLLRFVSLITWAWNSRVIFSLMLLSGRPTVYNFFAALDNTTN